VAEKQGLFSFGVFMSLVFVITAFLISTSAAWPSQIYENLQRLEHDEEEIQGTGIVMEQHALKIKMTGRQADHSPPSSAEVKNAWSSISIPPVHLHGVVLS
jgi:hypothetical protein